MGILDNGLWLSKPKMDWDDLNDYLTLTKYAEHKKKDVYVLCFCGELGSVHHWYYYGRSGGGLAFEDCYKNIKCTIKLNREKFEQLLDKRGLKLQQVEYVLSNEERSKKKNTDTKTLDEVVDKWDKLPIVKRVEYKVEDEWRVIAIGKGKNELTPPDSIDIKECVENVYILLDECSSMYCLVKNLIISKFPWLEDKIDVNGVHKSRIWEYEVNHIINNKLSKLW